MAACACILLVLGLGDDARGSSRAMATAAAQGTVETRTASWRAAPAPSDEPHLGMSLTLAWTGRGGDAVATFDVANVGDLRLSTQTIVIRDALAEGGLPRDPVTLAACIGGIWSASGTDCAGTTVELGAAHAGPLATDVALEPGERLSIRATTRQRTAAQGRIEVDVLVSRSAVRGPTTTSG